MCRATVSTSGSWTRSRPAECCQPNDSERSSPELGFVRPDVGGETCEASSRPSEHQRRRCPSRGHGAVHPSPRVRATGALLQGGPTGPLPRSRARSMARGQPCGSVDRCPSSTTTNPTEPPSSPASSTASTTPRPTCSNDPARDPRITRVTTLPWRVRPTSFEHRIMASVSFSEWGPSWRHPSPSSRLVG